MRKDKAASYTIAAVYSVFALMFSRSPEELAIVTCVGMIVVGCFYAIVRSEK